MTDNTIKVIKTTKAEKPAKSISKPKVEKAVKVALKAPAAKPVKTSISEKATGVLSKPEVKKAVKVTTKTQVAKPVKTGISEKPVKPGKIAPVVKKPTAGVKIAKIEEPKKKRISKGLATHNRKVKQVARKEYLPLPPKK